MPAPVVGPCGGPGQPACPPVPAVKITRNPILIEAEDGQRYLITESIETETDEHGEDGQ